MTAMEECLVVLDKFSGTFTTAVRLPSSELEWSLPRSVGFSPVESLAAGELISVGEPALAVTSRDFNNLQFVPLAEADEMPDAQSLVSPEPRTLATLGANSAGRVLAVGYVADPGTAAPLTGHTHGVSFPLWSSFNAAAGPRDAAGIHTRPGSVPVLIHAADLVVAPESMLSAYAVDEATVTKLGDWIGLPQGSRYVYGWFQEDVAAHLVGGNSATLLSWVPGAAVLRVARLADHEDGVPLSGLGWVSSAQRQFSFSRPIRSVHVLLTPMGGHRLLIQWADTAGGASVHSFDGDSVPELLSSLDLHGLELEGIVPLRVGGDFAALGKRGGVRAADLFSEAGSSGAYQRLTSSLLPALPPQRVFFSNVIVYEGEPLVQPGAVSKKRSRVLDWSLEAALSGSANVTALRESGGVLGDAGVGTVSLPLGSTHVMVNQLSATTSMALLSAQTSGQAALPKLILTPPPGNYPAPAPGSSFTVTLSSPGSSFDFGHRYSVSGGPWLTYDPQVGIELEAAATLRAYAVIPPSRAGSIVSAEYVFGPLPELTVQPMVDANANGLSDAWEGLTGISDPGGDDDQDGYYNLAEHNGGSDANDSASKPTAALPPGIEWVDGGGPLLPGLRWSAADPVVMLETSADLITWTAVIQGITQQGGEKVYFPSAQNTARQFYRLRR